MVVFGHEASGQPLGDGFAYVGIVIIAGFSSFMCLVMGSFFSYHIMLICKGQTTKERLTMGKNKSGRYQPVQSDEESAALPGAGLPDSPPASEDPLSQYIAWPNDKVESTCFWFNRPASRLALRNLVPVQVPEH